MIGKTSSDCHHGDSSRRAESMRSLQLQGDVTWLINPSYKAKSGRFASLVVDRSLEGIATA